ncbi:MAG: PAS domain-containing protein [Caldisericia bacterium]|nr:PAS domain-containing protein [Caldisericia bacterium]
MFSDLKPTIIVLNLERSKIEHISFLIESYSYKIHFLDNFSQAELLKLNPDIIIFFRPIEDLELVFSQVSMLRTFPNFFRTIAILIENNITPFRKRMALETGFDYIIPTNSINMLPSVVSFFTDISEYRHIQDSLFLVNIFSYVDLPIAICTKEGVIKFSNTSFKHFITKTNSKLADMSIYDFIHSKKLHTLHKHAEDVVNKSTAFSNIPVTITSLNQKRECFLTISHFPKTEKHEPSILYMLHEYTNTKKAEEKAYILQSVLDKSSNSILITNSKGTIVYANPSMLRRTNKKENTLLGESANILPKQYRIHSRKDISLYTKLGFTYFNEHEEICKNGDIILEKEKILPLNYNHKKSKGHLVRIAEYIKKQSLSNSEQKIWTKKLIHEMSNNIKSLHYKLTQASNDQPYVNDTMLTSNKLNREFEQMKGFIDIQSNEPFVLKEVKLDTIIKHVLSMFTDYPSDKFSLRLQSNLPYVYVDSSKIEFALLAILCEEIKKNQSSTVNISSSLHQNGVQLVVRIIYNNSPEVYTNKDKVHQNTNSGYSWIINQVFTSHNVKFTHKKEYLGDSIFFIFPISGSSMDLKKEEKLPLL